MANAGASKRVCVIGSGYVGLVTGACLAEIGHKVACVDSDRAKIRSLLAGRLPFYEPGLAQLVSKNVKDKRLSFCYSVAEGMGGRGRPAEIVFICVGTPPRADGSADLSYVEAVAEEIAKTLSDYTLIVEKSTVPVETGDWVRKTIERFNRRKVPFDVASNPEFLSEGRAVEDFLHPDRIVIGVASKRAERGLQELYAPLKAPLVSTDVHSAELIKHASNSFLATKISFINAVANVCERVGADVAEVARGMGLDRRIGPQFLKAGLGFGGSCFPKDLEAFRWISEKKGYDFKLLKLVQDINDQQRHWVLKKVEEELWNLEGKTVGLLGLSFKPETDDLRCAPSLDIIKALQGRRVKVAAYDPVAMPKAKPALKGVRFARDAYDLAKGLDALVIVTEWPAFKELDYKRIYGLMRHPILLDGRNLLEPAKLRDLGFSYRAVGRP